VVILADVRAAVAAHSQQEAPNAPCGLVLLRDGRADRYEPGRNAAASPYRFELEFDDPEIWYAEDDGYELAVFHSHVAAPARPSRTDVENIGLWAGKPYLVYSLQNDDLAAFRIEDGQIEVVPITTQ
jgi:proteasome lid subunit RPN8/RPN11